MNLEFIKPVYGAVKSVNGMTGDVVIEVPEANLEGYATEEYVAKKIAEAELAEGEVDLSAYYTKSETEAKIDEKIAAIEIPEPEIPDVDLSDYYNKAEVDAKIETIELTPGKDGKDGKDGYTPQKGVDYFDGKDGQDGKDYVLTEEDKREIADMVDVEGGGGSAYNVFEDIFFETDVSGFLVIPFDEFLDERMNASVGHNLWVECRTSDGRGWMNNYNVIEVDGAIVFEHLNEYTEGLFDATYDTASKSMTVTGDGHIKCFMQVNDSPFYTRLENDIQFARREEIDWRIDDVMMRLNDDYYNRWQIDEMLNNSGNNEAVLCAGEFTEHEIPFEEPQHEMVMNFVNDGVHVNLELINLADGAGWGYGMTPVEEDGMVIFPVDAESNDGVLTSLIYNPATRVLNVETKLSHYFLKIFIPAEKEYYMKHEADDRFIDGEELQHILEEIGGGAGGSVAVDGTTIVQNGDGTISTAIGGGRVMTAEPHTYIDYNDETGVTNPDYQTTACYVPLEQFDYHVFDASKEYLLTIEVRDSSKSDARTEYHGLCTITTDSYGATINPVAWADFSEWFSRFYYGGGTTIYVAFSKQAWQTADKIYVTRFTLEEPAQFDYQYIDSAFLNLDGDSFNVKDGMISTKLSGLNSIKSQAVVAQDTFNINSLYSKNTQILAFGTDINLTDGYYNATYYTTKDAIVLGSGNVVGCVYGTAVGRANGLTGNNLLAFGSGLSLQGHNKAAYGFCNEYGSDATVQIGVGANVSSRLTGLTIDSTGNVVTKGTVSNGGADYAEYFEWVDGNPEAEDRIGYMVTLEGDKIRFAAPGDEILGIISGTAAMIGDDAQWHWSKKYLTDEFGRIQHEYVEIKTEAFDADGNPVEQIEKIKTLKLNPDWDENASYVSRRERKEWDIVGLFGKLYVRDDGTCAVGGYASVGANGVATNSAEKTNMRVMERVNDNIIKVFMK